MELGKGRRSGADEKERKDKKGRKLLSETEGMKDGEEEEL